MNIHIIGSNNKQLFGVKIAAQTIVQSVSRATLPHMYLVIERCFGNPVIE